METESANHSDASTALIERMRSASSSPIRKYQEMFVGSRSLWLLLKYEVISGWLSVFPGALGFALRKVMFKLLLGSVGAACFFGRNVTLRCPKRIHIGSNVTVDDNVVLDAKGDPENSRIELGNDILIGRNSIISGTDARIEVGDYVSTGPNCCFSAKSFIKIGSNVSIGPNTYLLAGTHAFHDPDTPVVKQQRVSEGIVIGDNTWIGAGTIIIDGVTIGRHSIIGAGSVVTGDIPEAVVAAGTPARVIKSRRASKTGD